MRNVFGIKFYALTAALFISFNSLYGAVCTDTCHVESFCDDDCENFWASADVLFWRACEDGFECSFGTTKISTGVSDGRIVSDIREKDKDIDFDWDAGFRIGAGYTFDCSCWEGAIYWTHFNENGNSHDCNNHAKWKLTFNQIDTVLGYEFNYNSCFNFRPFFGARYAQINQRLSTHLETIITAEATESTSTAITIKKDREHFWGAGPLFGLEGNYFLGCSFSIYGNLAGSFLYGNFKNNFFDSDLFTTAINNCHSTKNHCGVLTGFDAGLGVRYEICSVTLQLGLEHHTYFDFNQIGCGGDLNLYGINASAVVRF